MRSRAKRLSDDDKRLIVRKFRVFRAFEKNMLAEYVRRGGGLIVFGGHKALDRAGLKGSLLEAVLPVTGGAGLPPLGRASGRERVSRGGVGSC